MSDLNRRAAEILWGDPIQNKNGNMKYWDKENYTMRDGNSFDPCNRIEHAWMLVEWLVEHGYFVDVQYYKDLEGKAGANCGIDKRELSAPGEWHAIEWDTSATLAITRAFLAAVGDSE